MSSCEIKGYEGLSQKIKGKLGLEKSPVAVKLVLNEEDIPENIPKIEEKIRHCEMIQKASKGNIFYAAAEEQSCKGGAGAIGIIKPPEKVNSAKLEIKHLIWLYKSPGRSNS